MKTLLTLTLSILVSGCFTDRSIDEELTTLEGHVEKSSTLRGTFCNGEPTAWYFEGRNFISGRCQNGTVFHLPLGDD
jgi:hypothetical protein